MTDRTVTVRLVAHISGYLNPIRVAQTATRDFTAELNRAASAGKLDALASGATRAGLVLAGGFALMNVAAARFEKQMSAVAAVSDASADDLKKLSAAAIKAGRDTAFSATEAGQAEEELAKAGLTATDILGGALSGALSLAAAGQIDLADAASISAKAMKIFGLQGRDVGHVADVLAAGANKSVTDVHDLALGMGMAGVAASQFGVGLEETVGVLSLFAQNAMRGSDAGTSLKQLLIQLAAPSDQAATLMKQLGIHAYDAAGNFVGLTKLAGILKTQLAGLTNEQRQHAMAVIFGSDAMRAANILYAAGAEGVADWTSKVNDAGAAGRTAAARLDNLAGDVKKLKGSLEALTIESGSGTNKGLRILAQGGEQLANQLSALPAPLLTATTLVAGLSGGSLLLFGVWAKGRARMADMVGQLNQMGPAGERASRGLQATVKWAGRAALAFAALQIAGGIASHFIDNDLNPQLDAAAVGLKRWDGRAKLAGEAARLFGDDAEELGTSLQQLSQHGFAENINKADEWAASILGMKGPVTEAKERVTAFDAALAQLVQSGNAAAAFTALQAAAQRANISVGDAQKVLPAYSAALETAAKGTNAQASAAEKAAAKTTDLAHAMGFATVEGEDLTGMWKRLHGALADADDTMLAAKHAVDDVKDAFKEGSKTVRGNTTAALENRVALEGAAKAAADAAQAYLANGGTAAGAARLMHDFQAAAEKATGATGANKTAVHNLATELFNLPHTKAVPVSAPGAVKASDDVYDFNRQLRNLPSRKSVTVSTVYISDYRTYRAGERVSRWGSITEHAATGRLRQAGVYAPPTRYAFAEPSTGGEAFIPRRGDRARSMSILSAAAGWYGATVVAPQRGWQGSGSAPGPVVNNTFQISVAVPVGAHPREAGAEIMKVLRAYENGGGTTWKRA